MLAGHDTAIEFKVDFNGKQCPLVIETDCHVPLAKRLANVKTNIERPLERLLDFAKGKTIHNEPLAICCGGPSLKKSLAAVRKLKNVMAAGSTHDFLIKNGIVPTFAVNAEGLDDTLSHYRKPHHKTHYIVASICPPELFDRLEHHRVSLWHFRHLVEEKLYRGEPSINGGFMVGISCIMIALFLGYYNLHFFGLDSCINQDTTHSYEVGQEEDDKIHEEMTTVYIGPDKKPFLTTGALMVQCTQFFETAKREPMYWRGHVYGDGMIAEIIRQSDAHLNHWLEAA